MSVFSSDKRFEYRTQASWSVLVLGVLFSIILARFFVLQIVRGNEYRRINQQSQVRERRIVPQRGQITDRKGRVMARNITTYRAYIIPHRIKGPDQTVEALGDLIGLAEPERRRLLVRMEETRGSERFNRIYLSQQLVGERCPDQDQPLKALDDPHHHYWCPKCGRTFEIWNKREGSQIIRCTRRPNKLVIRNEGRMAIDACGMEYLTEPVCPYDGRSLQTRTSRLVCPSTGETFNNEVALIESRKDQLQGVYVETDFRRDYPYGTLGSMPVGYVNEVNAREVDDQRDIYRPGDRIGRRGVERALEAVLRGRNGTYLDLRRRNVMPDINLVHYLTRYRPIAALPGHHVMLTLDLEIQKILKGALRDYESDRQGEDPIPAAAIVVIQPHTGAILGMYSKPTYDANHWANKMSRAIKRRYDQHEHAPMINRATTSYPPGSVFKPVTALAGLDLEIIDENTEFECPGYYEYQHRRFRCHKRRGHGVMNLHKAIVNSCDVYFYKLAELIGIDRLHKYTYNTFGLGQNTGIEISESKGWVPSREKYFPRRTVKKFKPGWTLSMAVGQGSLLTTPIQIAQLYAGIANDGKTPRLHIVDRIVDDKHRVLYQAIPSIHTELPFKPEHVDLVQQALFDTVNDDDGTGHYGQLQKQTDVLVSGKTGTAEAKEGRAGVSQELREWLLRDHAWFVGYAPATRAEIVVVVVLEHGGSGGKDAAPIFRTVVETIFERGLNLANRGQP